MVGHGSDIRSNDLARPAWQPCPRSRIERRLPMPTAADTDLLEANRQYVMRSVEERGVRFVRLWFVDVLGRLKSFAIPVGELEAALEEGVGLDGSALEADARLAERDVIAHPDPRTFQVL